MNLVRGVGAVFDGQVIGSRPVTVQLQAGQDWGLWVPEGATAQCSVIGPDGQRVQLTGQSTSTVVSTSTDSLELSETFRAAQTGSHQLRCTGAQAHLATGFGSGNILSSVGGIFGGVLAFIGGVAALVAAGIVRSRRLRTARR